MDLVSALAKLLTDRELRAEFRDDPWRVVRELGCGPADCERLAALSADRLDEQADALIRKRLHEVRGVIPETMSHLGGRGAELFCEFAEGYWPTGHRRHLLDGLEFCRHLLATGQCRPAKFELNLLRFQLRQRRLRLHLVRTPGERSRWSLQCLWRRKRGVKQVRYRLL